MSEHDDTLLDEDLGDEEYDLGNDEEEALLADDYELERQNSYKGEEETDDVLDLGVTDALDDLDGEDENIEFSRGNTDKRSDNDFYKDGEHPGVQTTSYYEQDENAEYANKHKACQSDRSSESNSVNVCNNIGKGDLREKLQRNVQKNVYIGNGQGAEDDDCEEERERRNRFQNERTIISPKMNNDIPDTLENVVTSEPSRAPFRGRGRSRGARGSRGGRFNVQNTGNFNPRFVGAIRAGSSFENQPPAYRPPLIETRPPCLLGIPSNVQNQQQIMYQQNNPQQSFQQPFGPNGPMQGPPTQFTENRSQFNPGQFQGGPLQLRPVSSRASEYGPRGPLMVAGGSIQGPNFNCPPHQPPYHPPMQPSFQNTGGIMQESRPMQGNQGSLLQGNPGGGSLLGNPNMLPGNPSNMMLPGGNLPMPVQGFPRQQQPLPSSQGPPMQNMPPNMQMPSQPPFENRLPPFQEPHFENRNAYDARGGYHPDQVSNSPFNNTIQPVPQQSASNVSHSVSLPPGHKILINPHFRGTVQPANDARLVWDSNQVQPQVSHSGQFPQSTSSYQNQGPYNQSQQGPSQYQQNYQQNKSDDPYAYFSDVWQENRPQKPQNASPSKHYSSDNNYSREGNYNDNNKYKSDSQWDQRDSYQEEHRGSHQNYRERDLPLRTRNEHVQRGRTPPNAYRSDSYDQNHTQKFRSTNAAAPRGVNKTPQKRISESSDKESWEANPKRSKPPNHRNLQEMRKIDTASEPVAEKKDEDNDPEMQEYRKKMEEQKRLREKILREKENRRKMAAMEKQNENANVDSNAAANENTQQETKPVSALIGVVKDNIAVKARPGVAKGRGRPVNTQSTEVAVDRQTHSVRIVRTIPTIQTNDSSDTAALKDNAGHINQGGDSRQVIQQSVRRVVIQKPPLQKIATTIQKTVSNLQKHQGLQHKVSNTQAVQTQKIVQNQSAALQKSVTVGLSKIGTVGQRKVTHKVSGGLQKTVINDAATTHGQKIISAPQNSQRIVLQKSPVQGKRLPEIKTNTVRLENLAASTSEAQIRRMCQPIGTIESIHMGEGNATIVFKTQSAAMVFHKKYQRKMLDLSLITVRLVPQSTPGNKMVTAVTKKS